MWEERREESCCPPVALSGQEDHVGVRVEEGNEDAGGHVEGEKVLRTRQLPGGAVEDHIPMMMLINALLHYASIPIEKGQLEF